MKTLKSEQGSKTVLYSFETKTEVPYIFDLGIKLIFSGTKTELQSKDDSFWEPLVEQTLNNSDEESYVMYDCAKPDGRFCTKSAKESGLSAISDEKEFIIITKEIL